MTMIKMTWLMFISPNMYIFNGHQYKGFSLSSQKISQAEFSIQHVHFASSMYLNFLTEIS